MDKKHSKIGKSLIENNTIVKITDLLNYLPKVAIAEGMGIHYNSLDARMQNPETITLESLLNLSESFEVDPFIIVNITVKECIEKRKKQAKKKG